MKRKAKVSLILVCVCCAAALLAGIAASAMASHTVLCKKNESVCAKGNIYSSSEFGTELTGYVGWEGTSRELELPKVATLTCASGKLGTSLKEQAVGPMTGQVERFTFDTPCAPTGCGITASPSEFSPGYAAELAAIGGGDGLLLISSPVLIATCNKFPLVFKCTYSTETMEVAVEGGGEKAGEHAYLSTETALSLQSGPGCPATANFRAVYEVYEPASALYVTN